MLVIHEEFMGRAPVLIHRRIQTLVNPNSRQYHLTGYNMGSIERNLLDAWICLN
jgi:hypothetical protein